MTDATEIARVLGLRRAGRAWRGACPSCGYAAALAVTERDGRALWWCASCRDGGAVTAAIRRAMGGVWIPPAPYAPPRRAAIATGRSEGSARALALWREAAPILGTPADRYLAARALPAVGSAELRFLHACPHPAGRRLPAMLAAVRDPSTSGLRAVHRVFLRPDGGGKADAEPAKASLGPVAGGAVVLDAPRDEAPLVVAEGVETALSAGRLLEAPAWSAVSAGNLETHLALPAAVRAVIVAADPDEVGQRAAWQAARRWRAEGRHVRVATPDDADTDFNDLVARRAAVEGVRHGAR